MIATTQNQQASSEQQIWAVMVNRNDGDMAKCLENLGFQKFSRSQMPDLVEVFPDTNVKMGELCEKARIPMILDEPVKASAQKANARFFNRLMRFGRDWIKELRSMKIGLNWDYRDPISKRVDELPKLSEIDRMIISMRI